ncbi:hypothetical protein OCK74_20005 [Chitinophagaceae bacterium LB-8]|uniref:LytR/CpsA/Psr regulator C-terminal domain-containing protein n=1 Tax=Paraflavisolibacter caeni TaxID=2982496 RepID=A0A9X2XZ92_9BACT|nr:hypothetical protein [Paraflavisolibacter caeni]MCU7551417.1 hypothetical protein [Paraflavisolibacter caeni]
MKNMYKKFFLTVIILFFGMTTLSVFAQKITKPVTQLDVPKDNKKKDPVKKKPQGTTSPKGSPAVAQLNEIKVIPCAGDLVERAQIIRNIISSSPAFKVKSFTEESNPVPQRAVDRLPNKITIRYFHPKNEANAKGLKTLLVAQGFDSNALDIENMMQAIGGTIPNYIEIWTKW